MTQPDLFETLDWRDYRCQCHKHPCRGRARHLVETHAVGHCNDPGLNPFGNHVELLCDECLVRLRAHIADAVGRLHDLPRSQCESCGSPISRLEDILRARSDLP